jgi:phage anti-repressor protein
MKQPLTQLLPVSVLPVGEELRKTVNARRLHEWLGVGKHFADWIKDRIEKYGFQEGEDFILTQDLSYPKSGSAKARPQTLIEYHITTDMAKELAMVENNAKGREARKYFIDVEKEAKKPKPAYQMHDEAIEAAIYYREVERKRAGIMKLVMPTNLHLYGTTDDDGRKYDGIRRATVVRAASRMREAAELHVQACQLEMQLLTGGCLE